MITSLVRNYAQNFDWAGRQVRALVDAEFTPDSTVLDVGAGEGKYRLLLPEFKYVDAVEIWEPVVTGYALHELYRTVFTGDIHTHVDEFAREGARYDLVIMGDVLEHLTVRRAQDVMFTMRSIAQEIFVIVPYSYVQGEEHGNPYQVHEQDDLTVENMHSRYPDLRLVTIQVDSANRPFKGLYRWR
jgi:hypothetical protein